MVDLDITTKCHGGCPWCYAKASGKGEHFEDICETWEKLGKEKPREIMIGTQGEPTEHPDFPDFLETVNKGNTKIAYTTNGVIIGTPGDPRARDILEATEKYCSKVNLSLGNLSLKGYQEKALRALLETGVEITLNLIISDESSVQRFTDIAKKDKDRKLRYKFLPLLDINQKQQLGEGIWEKLESEILKYDIKNVEKNEKPECMLLKKDKVVITKNSFDLRPIKIIEL